MRFAASFNWWTYDNTPNAFDGAPGDYVYIRSNGDILKLLAGGAAEYIQSITAGLTDNQISGSIQSATVDLLRGNLLIVDGARQTADNLEHRQQAGLLVDFDKGAGAKLLRAIAAALLDELNLHATKINAILTAIDSGATLAAVKTNILAVADYPQRTLAQTVTAIKAKINAGTVD